MPLTWIARGLGFDHWVQLEQAVGEAFLQKVGIADLSTKQTQLKSFVSKMNKMSDKKITKFNSLSGPDKFHEIYCKLPHSVGAIMVAIETELKRLHAVEHGEPIEDAKQPEQKVKEDCIDFRSEDD